MDQVTLNILHTVLISWFHLSRGVLWRNANDVNRANDMAHVCGACFAASAIALSFRMDEDRGWYMTDMFVAGLYCEFDSRTRASAGLMAVLSGVSQVVLPSMWLFATFGTQSMGKYGIAMVLASGTAYRFSVWDELPEALLHICAAILSTLALILALSDALRPTGHATE